jgi:heme oxygenase (biliverdin-IX-beta and delta-forming)
LNSVHKALREATADAHAAVDAAFAGFDLTDRADYARFLRAHAEVVLPLEADLPGARVTADWDSRKRGGLLREDLAQLPKPAPTSRHPRAGGDPESQAASSLTLDPRLRGDDRQESTWTNAQIAGTLYVLEGSRLGGKFLARQLPLGFPRAYLDADQRAEKWQQLLSAIDSLLRDPAAFGTAVEAAFGTFAAFERSASQWREVEIGD